MKKDLSLAIAAIRALSIDATNAAKSGHPGMPIGSAPLMATLFSEHMVAHPKYPQWINRDRFILSAGHASMLLYATLHVTGYDLSLNDLRQFRQLNSITPGHPEVHMTPGVDATTGPLGQGIAQAVGFALAERTLRTMYPQTGLIDHYTYVLSGDGCLQEGVSQEAISFAGHQKLNKLILFYDANDVTLDGPLHQSFSEDVKKRFEASGWQVLTVADGEDVTLIDKAIRKAKRSTSKPTMVMIKTIIGRGSINAGTYKVHGNPLGLEDGAKAKASYGWHEAPFVIPQTIYDTFQSTFLKRGKKAYRLYQKSLNLLKVNHLSLYNQFIAGEIGQVDQLSDALVSFDDNYNDATRNSSLSIINAIAKKVPFFLGGSADVAKSVMTTIQDGEDMSPNRPEGRNIHFGIREFGMAAIQNGMMLHRGLKTFAGTFLAFADYMKPAIRLAALSHIPSIFVFSHDSVALGEDGPTHQPIDQLAMLRAIPNVKVYRPADGKETLGAWLCAMKETKSPSVIVLSRQKLPLLKHSSVASVTVGAHRLVTSDVANAYTLVATGSEVSLALEIAKHFYGEGIGMHVVSMPCVEQFLSMPKTTQASILGNPYNKIVTLEALSTFGWAKIGAFNLGIDRFGVSAPGDVAMKACGIDLAQLIQRIQEWMQ